MYPDIDYNRDIDKAKMKEIFSSLKRYSGFCNVNLVPLKGKSDRLYDFEHSPIVFNTICRELHLTEIEKKCFLAYREQEFEYLCFNGWAPWRNFCSYMYEVYNIAIAYTDMSRLFCEAYSNYQGNVLSNSNFLHNLLTSNVMQLDNFSETSSGEIFNPNRL